MRLRRVLGCRPRTLAAPRGPSITHSVFARTSRMCRFSTCCSERWALRSPSDFGLSEEVPSPTSFAGSGSSLEKGKRSRPSRRMGPCDNTTARSITFCSSRMLPGQSYCVSASIVSCAMAMPCLPSCLRTVQQKSWSREGCLIGVVAKGGPRREEH